MEFEFDGTENFGGRFCVAGSNSSPLEMRGGWVFFFIFVVVGRLVCSPALAKCDFAHAESKP